MKFIANGLNGKYLRSVLPNGNTVVEGVLAAIAYGSLGANEKEDLIGNCLANNYRLDIWMRYDETVPVSVPLLNRLLKNHKNNIFCRLIPDCLHSKVIWWKGYGAYVGSANLTDRAWISNIEAGIFFTDSELESSGMIFELEDFFESLKDLNVSYVLTEEIIREMEHLSKLRAPLENIGKNDRSLPLWGGPNFTPIQKVHDKKKEGFQKEWAETLTLLRGVAEELKDNRPVWVEASVPLVWQADQFLNAYYYNRVGEGLKKPYEEYFERNKSNPKAALAKAIDWWKNTDTPPSNENHTLYDSAPYILEHLCEDKIETLTLEKFIKVCDYTHATRDHVAKIPIPFFGKDVTYLSLEERIPIFAEWLLKQRNQKGWDVRQSLHFVLYGGSKDSLWERLYLTGKTEEYHLPHYGLNSFAELVGWARPDVSPPRNGRTSKALRAIGYEVRIY